MSKSKRQEQIDALADEIFNGIVSSIARDIINGPDDVLRDFAEQTAETILSGPSELSAIETAPALLSFGQKMQALEEARVMARLLELTTQSGRVYSVHEVQQMGKFCEMLSEALTRERESP